MLIRNSFNAIILFLYEFQPLITVVFSLFLSILILHTSFSLAFLWSRDLYTNSFVIPSKTIFLGLIWGFIFTFPFKTFIYEAIIAPCLIGGIISILKFLSALYHYFADGYLRKGSYELKFYKRQLGKTLTNTLFYLLSVPLLLITSMASSYCFGFIDNYIVKMLMFGIILYSFHLCTSCLCRACDNAYATLKPIFELPFLVFNKFCPVKSKK